MGVKVDVYSMSVLQDYKYKKKQQQPILSVDQFLFYIGVREMRNA